MSIDIPYTYTLTRLQAEIIAALAATGPLILHDIGVAVRLTDVSKENFSELLKMAVSSVEPYNFLASGAYRGLDPRDSQEKSQYSAKQIDAEIPLLERLGLLEWRRDEANRMSLYHDAAIRIGLTNEGERLAQAIADGRIPLVRPPKIEQVSIFFAGAFGHEDIDLLYEKEVEIPCTELGYSTYRVDISEPFQTIMASLLPAIQNSACVLADLTYARPSVYFEVGVANGLGIPLVLTCRDDHLRNTNDDLRIHFDLAQYKISLWKLEPPPDFSWPKLMRPIERLKRILERSSALLPPR